MQLPEFLTQDDGGFIHITGSRIGLHHLIGEYNEGYSAEILATEYPTLTLALIHKVIAFYLENQGTVDEYIAKTREVIEEQVQTTPKGPGLDELRQRIQARSIRETQ